MCFLLGCLSQTGVSQGCGISAVMSKRQGGTRGLWQSGTPLGVRRLPDGELYCGDAAQFLSHLRPKCADIVFLDPPFNLGKRYGSSNNRADRQAESEYIAYMQLVLARAITVLRPGGALFLYHLPRLAVTFCTYLQQDLLFRHWIAISMKNGFARGRGLYPAHYALLYFTKGKPRYFRRPKIPPSTCRHCNGYLKDYGGYLKFVQGGINLSDVWDDLSPVRHKKYKARDSNELPLAIPERVVAISGMRGGLLVDPFAGSGTALLAARHFGMRFVGCEIQKSYCDTILHRLSSDTLSSRKAKQRRQ